MDGCVCGGQARPGSGGRGSCAGARCALRHGGSAIARLPSPPVAAASARPRVGRSLFFRKPAALPRDSSRSRVPRARPGRRRTAAFRRRRLARVCGAGATRCCRLAPPRPRIRRAMRRQAASVRLAGPHARPAPSLQAQAHRKSQGGRAAIVPRNRLTADKNQCYRFITHKILIESTG